MQQRGRRGRRDGEIQRGTGAPRDRLAARLKALVDHGILRRERYSEAPERFDYHLTDAGHELVGVLRALYVWGERWASAPGPGAAAEPLSRSAAPAR